MRMLLPRTRGGEARHGEDAAASFLLHFLGEKNGVGSRFVNFNDDF